MLSINKLFRYKITFCLSMAFISTFIGEIKAQSDEDFTGFYLVFNETANPDALAILELIGEDEELLYEVVEELNDYLYIPTAVPIIFGDCGTANAFYNSETEQIVMCYEMMVEAYRVYASLGIEGEDLSLAVANNMFSIMYHEIGHSLVDLLELPITGREEDAVDQFSVVSLLVFEELGQQALIHFAQFWGGLANQSETQLENMAFWDEHSLSSQRFYDILCLAYGSNNQDLSFLVENGILPESRAVRCNDEFERVANAWDNLLDPYIKD